MTEQESLSRYAYKNKLDQQAAQKKAITKGKMLENGAMGQAEYDSFSRQNEADRTEIYSRTVIIMTNDNSSFLCVCVCVCVPCNIT